MSAEFGSRGPRICPAGECGQRAGRATEEWACQQVVEGTPAARQWIETLVVRGGQGERLDSATAGLKRGSEKMDLVVQARVGCFVGGGESKGVLRMAGLSAKLCTPAGKGSPLGNHLHRGSYAVGAEQGRYPSMAAHTGLASKLKRWESGVESPLNWGASDKEEILRWFSRRWSSIARAAVWGCPDADGRTRCVAMLAVLGEEGAGWLAARQALLLTKTEFEARWRAVARELSVRPNNGGCVSDGLIWLQRGTGDLQWKIDLQKVLGVHNGGSWRT